MQKLKETPRLLKKEKSLLTQHILFKETEIEEGVARTKWKRVNLDETPNTEKLSVFSSLFNNSTQFRKWKA